MARKVIILLSHFPASSRHDNKRLSNQNSIVICLLIYTQIGIKQMSTKANEHLLRLLFLCNRKHFDRKLYEPKVTGYIGEVVRSYQPQRSLTISLQLFKSSQLHYFSRAVIKIEQRQLQGANWTATE
jgi:hypothetical protein